MIGENHKREQTSTNGRSLCLFPFIGMTYAIVRDVLYVAKLSCHKNVGGESCQTSLSPLLWILWRMDIIWRAQQVLHKFRFRCQDTATCQLATRATARANAFKTSVSSIFYQYERGNQKPKTRLTHLNAPRFNGSGVKIRFSEDSLSI